MTLWLAVIPGYKMAAVKMPNVLINRKSDITKPCYI